MEKTERINIIKLKELALKLVQSEDLEYDLDIIRDNYVVSSNISKFGVIGEVLQGCMTYFDKVIKRRIDSDGKLIGDGKRETYLQYDNKNQKPITHSDFDYSWEDLERIFGEKKIVKEEKKYDSKLLEEFRNKLEIPIVAYQSIAKIYGKLSGNGLVTWGHVNNVLTKVKSYENSVIIQNDKVDELTGLIEVNKFNIMPIKEVEEYFSKLYKRVSKNGLPFLEQKMVDIFIKKAFLKEENTEKLTLNYFKGEKYFVWKLFYDYYLLCTDVINGIERGKQCRDKYIKLMTDNFTNFTFEEVKANFNRSSEVKDQW